MSKVKDILLPWVALKEERLKTYQQEIGLLLAEDVRAVLMHALMKVFEANGYVAAVVPEVDGLTAFVELPDGDWGISFPKDYESMFAEFPVEQKDEEWYANMPDFASLYDYWRREMPLARALPLAEFMRIVRNKTDESFVNTVLDFLGAVYKLNNGTQPIYLIETKEGLPEEKIDALRQQFIDVGVACVFVPADDFKILGGVTFDK